MSKIVRRGACLVLAAAALLGTTHVSPAAANPVWDVQTIWGDTHLPPGGTALFKIQIRNVGDTASTGPVTVTDQLPPGVTRIPKAPLDGLVSPGRVEGYSSDWTCAGTGTVSCFSNDPVEPRGLSAEDSGFAQAILFRVQISPGANLGTFDNTTMVFGGGGASDTDVDPITISTAPAGFGMIPSSFTTDAFAGEFPDEELEHQAGARPFELRVNFDANLLKRELPSTLPGQLSPLTWHLPDQFVKTLETTLPAGLIGNPEATPKCSPDKFLSLGSVQHFTTGCPPETQVGILDIDTQDGQESGGTFFAEGTMSRIAVYNLEPPLGVAADFGISVGPVQVHIYPSLDAENDYAIKASIPNITTLNTLRTQRFTMWGVPGDPAHDHLRAKQLPKEKPEYGAPFSAPIKPLLTMPMDCDNPNLHMSGRSESWQSPGKFNQPLETESFQMSGCDDPRFRFKPRVTLRPTSRAASGPTGLEVNLEVPQRDDTVQDASELYADNGDISAIPTPPVKKVQVTFPEGMTLSTSAAQGLSSCSPEQIKLGTNEPVSCPDSSQYGVLTIETPILPPGEPMVGQIFIAEQDRNPFDDFLALYLVIQERERGLLVKLAGRIQLDARTGQITTTFDDLPQFPVSNMRMAIKGGIRAGLVNPATCGEKTITAIFTPWHDKSQVITRSSSYEITNKADGSPCVNDLRERPFGPQISAGTLSNSAGTYSPFVFRLTRSDDDQEISQLSTKLPQGLLAKVAGITHCPEAAIAASGAKTGKEEQAAPSCPDSSFLGTADVGSGVGQILTFVQGKAYLAGPYKGAPLSMVVITPVVAGPYDLGTIAVRTALDIDRTTAEVEVSTDPFPQVFKGIPVRIRDIRIKVDRPETTLNPTSCDRMEIGARITGTGGDLFFLGDDTQIGLSTPFQASNCAALPFKPRISFQLKGGTKRGDFPALSATLKARPGDANIGKARVTLPRSAFLEQGHIRTICTRVQFAAKACPPGSVIGTAKATSPLIDGALEGPVVMRSSNNKLPDLVATLNGIIEFSVSSRIDSFKKRIRSTFEALPDVPVDSFELRMAGGQKGLIVNSADLCKVTSKALVELEGQNGSEHVSKPKVKADCKGKSRKAKKQSQRRLGEGHLDEGF